MSTDDRWDEESRGRSGDEPEFADERGAAPPKRGMSTTVKVLLILLCGGGLLALLCCGGIILWFMGAVQQDPAAIRATLAEIVDMEVPEQFQPQAGMNMNMGFAQMKMAAFQSADGGVLTIAEMNIPAAQGQNDEEQIKQQLRQQNAGQTKNLIVRESETRDFEIKGQTSTFQFAKAQDEQGNEYRQVSGTFPGKGGTALLMLQTPEESYDEGEVVQMIESIR